MTSRVPATARSFVAWDEQDTALVAYFEGSEVGRVHFPNEIKRTHRSVRVAVAALELALDEAWGAESDELIEAHSAREICVGSPHLEVLD